MARTAMDMVAEAKREVEALTPEQVRRELDAGSAVVVDLRESEERRQHGSIPGAVHAPRGMLEFYADPSTPYHKPELDPSRRVILHCASGGRSALAARTLKQLGYTNVAHLDGGFKAWKETGNPSV
ncbi:MAG: rhodanese-like domain-containing protein [Longimicrobiales bacterium]